MPKLDLPAHISAFVRARITAQQEFIDSQAETFGHEWRTKNQDLMVAIVSDERMADVTNTLAAEGMSDYGIWQFIIAAWGTWDDFSEYRARVDAALRLCHRIGKRFRELSQLVQSARDTGAYLPPELLHPSGELNIPNGGYHLRAAANFHGWRMTKVMEELGLKQMPTSDDELKDSYPPDIVPLLNAISEATEKTSKKSLSAHVKNRIRTRQAGNKMDYLRVFVAALDEKSLSDWQSLAKPVSITATIVLSIVLDDPNIDVSLEDVRRAVNQVGG